MDIQLRNKIIKIGVFVGLIIIGAAAWYLLTPRSTITLALAPETTTLKYGDTTKQVKDGQSFNIKPGKYTFTFSRNEFSTVTEQVDVKNGQKLEVLIALTPLTDNARSIINSNPKSVRITQGYASRIVSRQAQEAAKNNPLLTKLPLGGKDYYIYACASVKYPKDATKQAICIDTLTDTSLPHALQAIKTAGFDPSTYEILSGSKTRKVFLTGANYTIDYFLNSQLDKPIIYINTTTSQGQGESVDTYHQRLLDIRTQALKDMATKGYDANNYLVYYTDSYLSSQFTPQVPEEEDHFLPPVSY